MRKNQKEELTHWGVLGMHWGQGRESKSRSISNDFKTAREIKRKHTSEMSNEDIRLLTTRLDLEKKLKDAQRGTPQKARGAVVSAIGKAGTQVLTGLVVAGLTFGVKQAFKYAYSKAKHG